ncbi:MAG: hypothetical protein AB7S26_33800 [Sandaracinaceae bacterium]
MPRWTLAALFTAALSVHPSRVFAHPRIDQARASFEEADLDGAMSSLDEAFDLGHLTRAEYLDALVLRALVASALRRDATRDDALRQLAAIDPMYELPSEAPPSLVARSVEMREQLGGERVSAVFDVTRSGERFAATLRLQDPVRAVATTSIVCRAGRDTFQSEGRDVFGLVGAWASIECVAQLLGRGGTLLEELEQTVPGDGTEPPAPPGGDGDALAIGLGLGIGLAVAAAAAIVLVVLLMDETPEIQRVPTDRFIPPVGFSMP